MTRRPRRAPWRAGRPIGPGGEVRVRLAPAERAKVEEAARRYRTSVEELVRIAVLVAADCLPIGEVARASETPPGEEPGRAFQGWGE